MCAFIQKTHLLEILQLDAEFIKDENGYIWLSYAADIEVRKTKAAIRKEEIVKKKEGSKVLGAMEVRQNMLEETKSFGNERTNRSNKILGIMDKYYQGLKDGMQFDDHAHLEKKYARYLVPREQQDSYKELLARS